MRAAVNSHMTLPSSTQNRTKCFVLLQVVCQGKAVNHITVASIVEVLQSYAACRGLAFMGCNFEDQALHAVTSLLLRGSGK